MATSLETDDGKPGAELLRSLSSRRELASLLGVSWQTLAWMLFGRGLDSYYNTWIIKKRWGGKREIAAPHSTLYRIQKRLSELLYDAYKPRPAAHGFVIGRSLVSNANPHVKSTFVLNVDLVDFFPSIHLGRVRGLFLAHPFSCQPEVATTLAQICCWRGKLPIGAPTSPVVSNMVCVRMDRELQRLANGAGCRYTRYADDLTFSTKRSALPPDLADTADDGSIILGDPLLSVLEANGFAPNYEKVRLQTRRDRQLVTGIKVNERLNLDRRYVRRIRGMLHAWEKYGLDSAQAEFRSKYDLKDRYPGAEPRFERVLRGRIAYLAMVRAVDDPMVRRFMDQYDNLRHERPLNDGIDYDRHYYEVERDSTTPPSSRSLLTILFTDIVDSTAHAAEFGDRIWAEKRDAHNTLIRSEVRRREGRVWKWIGDASMSSFTTPSAAVEAALRIASNVRSLGIEIRAGAHIGEVDESEDDLNGMIVNIAARVEGLAGASQVLVTQTLRDVLEGGRFNFLEIGTHKLKNVPEDRRLFEASLGDPDSLGLERSSDSD